MTNEWWPTHLSHIPKENPWDDAHVVVAEIKSFNEKPHAGHRTTFSALVPIDQVDQVKKHLAKLRINGAGFNFFGSVKCEPGPIYRRIKTILRDRPRF